MFNNLQHPAIQHMMELKLKKLRTPNFNTMHNLMTMSLIHDIQISYINLNPSLVYPIIHIIYLTNYNLSMKHTIDFVLSLPSSMRRLGKESILLSPCKEVWLLLLKTSSAGKPTTDPLFLLPQTGL
jgi:hypothetical protein